MPRHLALLLVASALSLLPGCFFSSRELNQHLEAASFTRLEPGKSTAKEVVEVLGAPTEVVQLGHRSAYRYDYTRTKEAGLWLLVLFLHGTDTQSDRAWVFFDEKDVLTHVGTTFQADQAEYAIPPQEPRGE
jgi:outer membrane protein assembly factor BamE (lipoprotein component of BamABCDE complex)